MLATCRQLVERPAGLAGRLLLAGVVDEESGASGVRTLIATGLSADAAIIGEPTDNRAVLASRGLVRLAVEFLGRAAHASSPSDGINATYGAARFILAIEQLNDALARRGNMGNCAATVVTGGSILNVVPDACTVEIDRRLGPSEVSIDAIGEIERIARRSIDGCLGLSFRMRPAGASIEAFEIPSDDRFATSLLGALGQPVAGPIFQAVSDAPHLISAGIPTAILGPGSLADAHTADESVMVKDLMAAVDRYERVARAFLGADTLMPPASRGSAR
jgi:acetylornithine deacetylase/succinyl-diaminopimelate desuccinylase-like protein